MRSRACVPAGMAKATMLSPKQTNGFDHRLLALALHDVASKDAWKKLPTVWGAVIFFRWAVSLFCWTGTKLAS